MSAVAGAAPTEPGPPRKTKPPRPLNPRGTGRAPAGAGDAKQGRGGSGLYTPPVLGGACGR